MSRSDAVKSFHQGTLFGGVSGRSFTEGIGISVADPFRRVKEDVGEFGGRVGEEGGNLTDSLIRFVERRR